MIVQKSDDNNSIENRVTSWGGEVTRNLPLIHSFAVRLPARLTPNLAALEGVNWVSLNGKMYKSSLLDADGSVQLREEFDNTGDTTNSGWAGLGTWSGQPWQEIGESDGAASGDIAVTRFFGGELTGLRLQNNNKGLMGFANLSDAKQVMLSYAYRQKDLDDAADFVTVEVSADGGASWTTLKQYVGPATDSNIEFTSFDISAYATDHTAIRFVTSSDFDATDKFYVDFVQLEFVEKSESEKSGQATSNRLFLPLVSANQNNISSQSSQAIPGQMPEVGSAQTSNIKTVCDVFPAGVYNGNCGWENWAGSWVENEVSSGGSGPSAGHVQVVNEALRLDNYPSTGGQPSVTRKANLSNGVVSAVLAFGIYTSNGVDASDTVVVEVSKDGGATYTVLETFTGITGFDYINREINVSNFASANFMVRFRVKSNYTSTDEYFYVDYLSILYERVDSGTDWTILALAYSYGWKYIDGGLNLGTTWRDASFNDSTWPVASSELSYGEGDSITELSYGSDPNNKPITTYFRRSFYVANAAQWTSLNFQLLADDGAIVYLNGTEVVRYNMPAGIINASTRASTDVDGAAEFTFIDYAASPSLLVNGENVIGVEVHQFAPNTSDMSFNLEFGGVNGCMDCVNTTVWRSNNMKNMQE